MFTESRPIAVAVGDTPSGGGIIQGVVIVIAVFVALYFVVGKAGHGARAWRKIAVILLGLAMVFSVLFPSVTSSVAHVFGVGRGADLLLYVFVLAFILYVLNAYIRGQKDRDLITRLARRIAIIEARQRYQADLARPEAGSRPDHDERTN